MVSRGSSRTWERRARRSDCPYTTRHSGGRGRGRRDDAPKEEVLDPPPPPAVGSFNDSFIFVTGGVAGDGACQGLLPDLWCGVAGGSGARRPTAPPLRHKLAINLHPVVGGARVNVGAPSAPRGQGPSCAPSCVAGEGGPSGSSSRSGTTGACPATHTESAPVGADCWSRQRKYGVCRSRPSRFADQKV